MNVLPEARMVTVGPDGVTPLYRISGTYVYGCTDPSDDVFSDVVYPRPPWLIDAFDRFVQFGQFEEHIINI